MSLFQVGVDVAPCAHHGLIAVPDTRPRRHESRPSVATMLPGLDWAPLVPRSCQTMVAGDDRDLRGIRPLPDGLASGNGLRTFIAVSRQLQFPAWSAPTPVQRASA